MIEIGRDQRAAGAQQPAHRLVQRRRRRVAVEKGDVVAGIERRQHGGKIAFVHGDAVIERGGRDVVAGKLRVLGIALDAVDGRVRRAGCERQRGVAERRAQFQDAARIGSGRQRRQQRSVVIRIGAAAMPRAVRIRRGADGREGIGQGLFHCGHSFPPRRLCRSTILKYSQIRGCARPRDKPVPDCFHSYCLTC